MTATPEHFFVVGAQRSGTTYLHRALEAHPEIEMASPARPEPKYFLARDHREGDRADYERRFFDAAGRARVRGEKSTSYLGSELAARRIHAAYPDARIVMVLREPVARALSNHRFSTEHGFETLPAWEAFEREEERRDAYDASAVSASPFAYLQRSRYIDSVQVYERIFGRARLCILLYEQLIASIAPLQRLYGFLGVDPTFAAPRRGEIVNATPEPTSWLTDEQRRLLQRRFRVPNEQLASRYGLDLSCWETSRDVARHADAT